MLPRALTTPCFITAALLLPLHAHASDPIATIESDHLTFHIQRVAHDLHHPWAVAFLPDGRYLVSERSGALLLVERNGEKRTLSGIPDVSTHGQGGLLDVSLHPRFGEEGGGHDWVYFTWSKPDGNRSRTALSRAKWQNDALHDVELVFEQNLASAPGRHYGSRIAWLPDDTLLMSIGCLFYTPFYV
ncbi:PQQ-dependent sugar dehydrogenase [Vreelandella massiliensis]|uniref:PQQ-dependent sugar dehydrogenase n=1 Tax=Vreelandella massiliensis TaxID=1816686 RepID=UPI0009F9BE40